MINDLVKAALYFYGIDNSADQYVTGGTPGNRCYWSVARYGTLVTTVVNDQSDDLDAASIEEATREFFDIVRTMIDTAETDEQAARTPSKGQQQQ